MMPSSGTVRTHENTDQGRNLAHGVRLIFVLHERGCSYYPDRPDDLRPKIISFSELQTYERAPPRN